MRRDVKVERAVELLAGLAQAERSYARAVAAELGMSATDLFALGAVLGRDPLGVVDVGRTIGIGSAAATALVDRLEAAGYVTRQRHPEDRRRIVVVATPAARRRLLTRLGDVARETTDVAAGFSSQELAVVTDFLERVIAVYRDHSGER